MEHEHFDHVVLGAGLSGLGAALRRRREHPHETLLVVDAMPRAGGTVATQRSNGFVCELGPFAFARADVAALLEELTRPPQVVEPLTGGRTGHVFDGARTTPVAIDPVPISFVTGNEELVQACRRELGSCLRLGRTASALRPTSAGVEIALGGEAGSRLETATVTLALPAPAAAALLSPFDRSLQRIAEATPQPRAFVFLGGHEHDAPELRGFGIVPAAGVASPCAEAIFCTQVFAQRALPGRCLVRLELAGDVVAGRDADLRAVAGSELRRWTGTQAPWPFAKVHRFPGDVDPAVTAEGRARLRSIAASFGRLTLA